MTPEGERLDRFLGEAIGDLKSGSGKVDPMSAGVRRLANLTSSLTKEMDDHANALADRLQKARDRSTEAMGKFGAYVDTVETAAKEAEDTINQLTNGAPLPSSDSAAKVEG